MNADDPDTTDLMFDPPLLRQMVQDFGVERVQRLLDKFLEELRLHCAAAAAAVAAADAAAVDHAAHTIRGMSASFGCSQLVAHCDDLRRASEAGDAVLRDALALQLNGMRLQLVAALAALRRGNGALGRAL